MNFEEEHVRLPVRFGPKTLFRIPFRASVYREHFADLKFPFEVPEMNSELIVFPSIPENGTRPKRFEFSGDLLRYSPKQFPRYLADLTVPFEDYLSTFGSKSKSTLKRKVRKFQDAAGSAEYFRQYKTPHELEEFHAIARELSKRTYQERLLGSGLPDTERFKSKMLTLAAAGDVRAYTLHLDDEAVAYLYSPARDGVLYYDHLGYDPKHGHLSPGAVLQYLAFEQIFAEKRFQWFDFEEGEGQHKRQFATTCIQCSSLMIFRRGMKACFYIAADYLLGKATAITLKILDKLKLRTKVRQSLR